MVTNNVISKEDLPGRQQVGFSSFFLVAEQDIGSVQWRVIMSAH